MLKRMLGLLGWLGVALVFAAVAIRFLKPEWQQYYNGLAIAGLVCTLLYILSQWREIGQAFWAGRRLLGTSAAASILVVLGILAAINYLSNRHNKRWDLTAAHQFSMSDQTKKVLRPQGNRSRSSRLFARSDDHPAVPAIASTRHTTSRSRSRPSTSTPRRSPTWRKQCGVIAPSTVVFEYKGGTRRRTSPR